MSDEKKEISKAPPPIEPLSGSSSPPLIWHKPDWNFWKHKTKIKLWEAAFLCCDIDPHNQDYRDIKGRHYEKVAIYLDLLKDNLNRLDFDFVNLPEVVEWALSKDLDIPKELAAFAKKPDTATATKSEKQDTNLTQSKQESKETSAQDTTADAQNKDKKDALAIADRLLSKDRLRRGELDEVMGLAIQKAESMYISKVWPELRALSDAKKAPFNRTVIDGGLGYWNYKCALVRINKKALEKRLDRLKKQYL